MKIPDGVPLDCGDWDGTKSAALLDHMITEFCEAFDRPPTSIVMVNVPARLFRRFPWLSHPAMTIFDSPTHVGGVRVQGSGSLPVFACGKQVGRLGASIYMSDGDRSVISDVVTA